MTQPAPAPRTAAGRALLDSARHHHQTDCAHWGRRPCDCGLLAAAIAIEREAEAAAGESAPRGTDPGVRVAEPDTLRDFVDQVANLSTRHIDSHPRLIFDLREQANATLALAQPQPESGSSARPTSGALREALWDADATEVADDDGVTETLFVGTVAEVAERIRAALAAAPAEGLDVPALHHALESIADDLDTYGHASYADRLRSAWRNARLSAEPPS